MKDVTFIKDAGSKLLKLIGNYKIY